MSGFMRKAALVVGAVALIAATAGAAAVALAPAGMAGAAGIGAVSAATLTAIGTYGGLAAGVLSAISVATAPKASAQGSATTFQTNPQSGLPYVMGRTRMSGLRSYAATNTRPGYTKFNDLLWFGALLSIGGQIEGIERFTADNELVTFDASGNAVGNYHDYQGQKIHLGGPQASALALSLGGGSAPGWTSQHRLSGITHAMWCLRYNKQGEMYGAGAPEPAWIGKWVKVYDPRLDSTYPGGSGPCRALTESTYVWSQNPGLHALTWALGRWQNGKRTCGIGAPVANIRVAEFVECANVCDANNWNVGGVEWTTDSKWDTLKRILQAGGARPTQTGAMIGCLVSMPRTAIATIESRHLLDSLSIAATKSRRDRFNSVIPRYVDEDSDWSLISGTVVTVPDYVTADRGQRTKEVDYPLVQVFSGQVAKQPGQLAAYDIVNSREAGPINFTTGPEWIGLKTGDVILLNVPEEGLINQPVLITRRAPDPSTGKVSFSAETETYAKHAYALGQSTTPPAPFSLVAPDLKPPAPALAQWAATGTVTGEGLPAIVVTGISEMPSADAVLIDYKLPADAGWTRSVILSALDPVRHVIAPLKSETPYQVRVGYRVGQIDGEYVLLAATTGVGKLSGIEDGATNGMNPDERDILDQLEIDTAQAQIAIAAAQAQIQDIIDNGVEPPDLTGLYASVEALEADAAGLHTSLTSVQGTITDIQGSVSDITGEVATLATNLSTANANIALNATAITGVQGSVANLSSTVSAQAASISTNATAISTVQGNLAALTTRVESTNVNLVKEGGFEAGGRYWSSSPAWTFGVSGGHGTIAYTSTLGTQVIGSAQFPVFATASYTIAADMAVFGAGNYGYVDMLFLDAAGNTVLDGSQNAQYATFDFSANTQRRALVAVTAVAPTGAVKAYARCVSVMTSAGTVGFRQVKAEQGNTWSPYTADASIVQSFQALQTLDTSFASLTTTVSSVSGNVTTLQSSMTTAQGNISTLQSTVTSQGGQISNNATAISTLSGTVSTLSSTVSTQGASITSLQTAQTTAAGQIAALNTKVQAGGNTNIIRGLELGLSGWNGPGYITTVSGGWGTIAYRNTDYPSGLIFLDSPDVPVFATAQYTASADSALQIIGGTGSVRVEIIFKNGSGTGIGNSQSASRAATHDFTTDGASRAVLTVTGTAPAGTAYAMVRLTCSKTSGTLTAVGWRQVKLEQGSLATPYTQEASVAFQASAITTANSSISALSSTVSTQGSTISSQATAITTLQGTTASLQTQINSANASISSNGTAISTLQGNVASLTTRVSAGGANLLPNGGLENGFATGVADAGGFSFAPSGTWGATATAFGNGYHEFQFATVAGPQVGATYTFAFDPLAFGSSNITCDIACLNGSGAVLSSSPRVIISGGDFSNNNDRRAQVASSILVPTGTASLVCRILGTVVGGQPIGFRRAKLETGGTWTPYSSEASIVQSFQTLSTLTTQYASLSSTVSTQGVTVSSHSTAITTINGNVTTLFAQAGVNLDVDGFVSGWKLNNNGAAGDMIVDVDRFALGRKVSGVNQFQYPFQMIGSTTYIKNAMIQNAAITNAKIGNLEVSTIKIAGGAITANQVATAADISVSTSATVTFLETGWMTVGDGTYSQALVNVNFTLDGAVFNQFDAAGQLRLYIDAGTGYYEARRQTLGVSTNNGDSYWRMAGQLQTVVSAVSIRVKAECTSGAFIQSSVARELYVRDIVMTLLGAKR